MGLNIEVLRREANEVFHGIPSREGHADKGDQAKLRRAAPIRKLVVLDEIARKNGFRSWARLACKAWLSEMNAAERAERLRSALYFGQHWVVHELLANFPETANADLGIQIALFNIGAARKALSRDPKAATRPIGKRTPILHLAFSRHIHAAPHLHKDAIEIAALLVENGADVNDGMAADPESNHKLSALYGAVGHADNHALAEWLLRKGADPNDNESLYHSTEVGHHRSLDLLLKYGAEVQGTNALLRALDFNDHKAVASMLRCCGSPDAEAGAHPSRETEPSLPALHQAARRMCDAKMAFLLMDAGADAGKLYSGLAAHGIASVYGNKEFARALEQRGHRQNLSGSHAIAALAAEGKIDASMRLKPEEIAGELNFLVHNLQRFPERLGHLKRLISLGFPFDSPDEMDLTPVQIAGWEGLPDAVEYWLSLGPDLEHVNAFGGNLLSTIVHGSENCPQRRSRDHISCAWLALRAGVPLPRKAPRYAGGESMAGFLEDWAADHPDQVVENGVY